MICFQNFRCQSQTGSRWQRGQGGQICLQTISCNSNSGTVHRFSAIPCRKHTKTHVHKLLILFPSMCREHWLTCHIWTSNGCWELDSAPSPDRPTRPDHRSSHTAAPLVPALQRSRSLATEVPALPMESAVIQRWLDKFNEKNMGKYGNIFYTLRF